MRSSHGPSLGSFCVVPAQFSNMAPSMIDSHVGGQLRRAPAFRLTVSAGIPDDLIVALSLPRLAAWRRFNGHNSSLIICSCMFHSIRTTHARDQGRRDWGVTFAKQARRRTKT